MPYKIAGGHKPNRINVYVNAQTRAAVDELARREGSNPSAIGRRAITAYFAGTEEKSPSPRKRTKIAGLLRRR